ncbi:MAG: hypothetical protein V3V01_19570 [Acidimicrobiales bacterium]
MRFLLKRPGATLLIVGVAGFLVRSLLGKIPLIGGVLSMISLVAAIFFVIGGIWIMLMGSDGDSD